jgi:hypothetical protein
MAVANILGGTGVVPAQNTQVFTELNSLTRRAFVPRVTVQLYYSTPTIMMLLAAAQRSAGGLNQITFPVQGQSMVQGAWTSYSGQFNKPQVIPGVQNAAFNTAYFLVPVPLVMGEVLIQSTEAIIPILDVRMNDVYAVTAQQMGSAVFTNNTANTLMPNSFVDGFDDGTNVASYGGINRNAGGNGFWKGQRINANGGVVASRQQIQQYIIQITDAAGGETPDYGAMNPSDYAILAKDFIGSNSSAAEPINVTPGRYSADMDIPVRSSFPNVYIGGVPFFMDHWCPKGTMYFVNSRYTAMYLSEDAPFIFSGFYSAIPVMQLAQIGLMVVGYNILCAKPLANASIFNMANGGF